MPDPDDLRSDDAITIEPMLGTPRLGMDPSTALVLTFGAVAMLATVLHATALLLIW